jgi:hypothetical protein
VQVTLAMPRDPACRLRMRYGAVWGNTTRNFVRRMFTELSSHVCLNLLCLSCVSCHSLLLSFLSLSWRLQADAMLGMGDLITHTHSLANSLVPQSFIGVIQDVSLTYGFSTPKPDPGIYIRCPGRIQRVEVRKRRTCSIDWVALSRSFSRSGPG